MLAGYLFGVWTLATVLRASTAERKSHARSCLAALMLGTLGLVAFLAYLFGAPADCALLAIKLGTYGLLLPIYFTVMHRMLPRSEEHTSELQSLMRISYAVFCLKKKKYDRKQEKHNK